MGYDFQLRIDAGGKEKAVLAGQFDETSGHTDLWKMALGEHIVDALNEKRTGDCEDLLVKAVSDMALNSEKYNHNVDYNGRGDYDDAFRVLRRLLVWSKEHPNAEFWIW